MRNLIFRLDLDSGKTAGTGHFKRVEIIYNFLKEEYPELKIFFLYKKLDNSKNTLNTLTKKNHFIYEEGFEKKLNFVNVHDIFICDTPLGIDISLKKFFIKKNISKILLIDDLNKVRLNNCTIVNGITSFKKKIKTKGLVKVYSGDKYILLNKLYLKKTIKKANKKFTILVTLGGTDLNNNLYKIIIFLSKISNIKILLIIGSQTKKKNPIFGVNNKNIIVISNKKNIYKYFCESDITITAGGISMFESVSLKKPTLVFQTHSHQKFAIKYLLQNNAIIKIGENGNIQNKKLFKIINFYRKNKILTNLNSANIDGKGYYRIIKIIKKIINK